MEWNARGDKMNKKVIVFGLIVGIFVEMFYGSFGYAEEISVEESYSISKEIEATEEEKVEANEMFQLSLEESIDYALENSKEMIIQGIELEKA